jgi:protoporphyrin/coproporphyrin ferrochelatase
MAKWGVILMNLGTPAAPTKKAYREFLKAFLSDPRVVEIPRLIWWPILNLFILPFRSGKLVKAYQNIWDDREGAPLSAITRRQAAALGEKLNQQLGDSAPTVTYAMTYGEPGLTARIDELQQQSVEKILVLPLYPQYSATTIAPVYDQFAALIARSRNIPDITINKCYFDDPDYIAALAQSIEEFSQYNGVAERLLISFHGIPQRCVDLGDPYFAHCQQTAKALWEYERFEYKQWGISFQSRFGKAQWLKPYTVDVLRQWAQEGVKTVDVICPAFAADCLETLEEIAVEAKAVFQAAGGDDLRLVPCLNDREAHIALLAKIAITRMGMAHTNQCC